MTGDRIALQALIEKAPDTDFLREMIGFAAERLMVLEVDGLCGASHGERNAARANHRNGYRERAWETRAGAITLPIPSSEVTGDVSRVRAYRYAEILP